MKTAGFVQIMRVDHTANEFQTIGGAGFLTMRETKAEFAALPCLDTRSWRPRPVEYIADLVAANGDILDTKTITRNVAITKLGRRDFMKGLARALRGES